MDNFIPDIYQKSVYAIDYKALKKSGIKCLIFDLNNTIAPLNQPIPSKSLKDLFAYLEGLKFKIIILSNSNQNRVAPFKERLNVDASFHSHKPSRKKYLKILNLYHLKVHEVASIGDQLLTDIYGANRMGFTSILVNPISHQDYWITKFNRMIERHLFHYFARRGLFKKGTYYE
ncbi:MAG: YqeG family HAD IIIA-type phosphatase [Bacilli bacterium]|nr:YqeG family HAD IIIA-type phosphatase [Bacilli bacterium]